MKIRTACLGALALTVLSGTAFAGALDEPTIMGEFYVDQAMKTIQSPEKMKVAWGKMSKENQEKIMKECQDAAMSKPHAEFCEKVQAIAGAN